MATKIEPDCPSPSMNDESEPEDQEPVEDTKPPSSNVADILKRLQSTGALLKKPKQEYRCYTCEEDFNDWEDLENHLIQHVSLPSLVLEKLPSDDEDNIASDNENWSDDEVPSPTTSTNKTPQKVDISQILKNKGITLKKPTVAPTSDSSSALNKLSGLGFTIKKGNTPIKEEKEEHEKPAPKNDLMKKLGQLGGIKLKLKSDGSNTNSFKVVNGLKDFNASEDEDEGSGNEDQSKNESYEDDDPDKDLSGDEQNTPEDKNSDSEDLYSAPLMNMKTKNSVKNLEGKVVAPNPELKGSFKGPAKGPGRPVIKQTPKRGENVPIRTPIQVANPENKEPVSSIPTPPPERRSSRTSSTSSTSTVLVKQESDAADSENTSVPLFSGQIKSERVSPPPSDNNSTPLIASVKSEPQPATAGLNSLAKSVPAPLLSVPKQENLGSTVIEINGDSNDEDDDCCVVSTTPAPTPIVPKLEPLAVPKTEPAAIGTFTSSVSAPTSMPSAPSVLNARLTAPYTEKQHSFNWNAPESKPAIDMLEKSTDDIFQSLLSSATKRENLNLSEASEYISLDTLGPQHCCDVCNTRFTSISLLDDHRRMTGHSSSLVMPTSHSTSMLPYSSNQSSSLLSSLLPVKHLAEQVGKLVPTGMGNSGAGFTHQQNVMINIQAYPGGGMVPNQQTPYNSYGTNTQTMHSGYQQPNNMYGSTAQTMPGQYSNMPSQPYMGQQTSYGQQYQPPMSQANAYSSPYSTHSPLQSMQQSVYGQANTLGMNQQMHNMMPPISQSNHYTPASSPGGSMKPPPGGIKIQNVQTFPSGQVGQAGSTQSMEMPPPPQPGPPTGQIRMAPGANITRPRMAGPRGSRPMIRPGVQVQGQVRGGNPRMRMPMKRPGGMPGGPMPKKRPDMLLPGKHDNEDCQVMAMQKQREGMPLIQSVQSTKDKLNLGSQISITKKPVNKAAAMANVLASRGISIKQKQRSRSPSPERPLPHIPNLGSGMSIKHTNKSSNFSIPEAKIGAGMVPCRICRKSFASSSSLQLHMNTAHPQSKIPMFKCDECPASYPKSLQLQHHKRTFHNQTGVNRELGLPVVDLSQQENLERLSSLGIYSYIPLANREMTNGCFGIPIISVHNMQNGNTKSLQALGADGLLSLGPLKSLPNS